jgi:molybdate transport system substrate-binding protein
MPPPIGPRKYGQAAVGDTWSHAYAVVTDGRLHLGLHGYEFDSPALTWVRPDLAVHAAALESLGAWPSVAGRLAQAENVRVALTLVARGEAPLGIVYATDARAEPRVRVLDTFPASSHPPIVYPAAVVAASRSARAAAFLDWLRSPAGVAVFAAHGFAPAPR